LSACSVKQYNIIIEDVQLNQLGLSCVHIHSSFHLHKLPMKTTFKTLLAVAAFATFATTSCSQKTQDNAEATAESAANDASNTADKAADATSNAADNVDADMAPERGDTAVVQNKEANKLVEETPEKK
jgi:hypothetical protein